MRTEFEKDPTRLKAINEMAAHTKIKAVESFLGRVNYYRRYVCNLSKIEEPLRDVIFNPQFIWTNNA